MAEKKQKDVPAKNMQTQESTVPSIWERNAFLYNLRAGFGVIFGILFFVCAMLLSFQLEQRFGTAEPMYQVELLVIFAVLMHLVTDWFWFCVLGKWAGASPGAGSWLVISVFAFVIFILAGAITLAAFVSYVCEFFWENTSQWWRVLPILCVIASIGRMIYKLKTQDLEKE